MQTYKYTLLGAALLIALGGTYWIAVEKNGDAYEHNASFVGRERALEEDAEWYAIQARYPAETTLAREASIRALAIIETTIEDIVDSFKRAHANPSVEERAYLSSLEIKYAQEITYTPYVSERHISYAFLIYENTGGAHPNSYYRTLVFDENGEKIPLRELFADDTDYLERISREARRQIEKEAAHRTEGGETSLFDEGLEPVAANFENFVIDGDELVFFIPPYQVAAYALGSFEVRIPLEEFEDIVPSE